MQKTDKILLTILSLLLFLTGAVTLAYPHVHGFLVDTSIMKEAAVFLKRVTPVLQEEVPAHEENEIMENTPLEESREHKALWDAMVSYNQNLYETNQAETANSGVFASAPFTLEDYDLENEVFGVISIPKLELEMPILLGASDTNMAAGAAVLNQTSIPIGGINTNCVLGGHRGYQGASYFLYVPELEPGDEVIITNLWETLTYVVTGSDIIDPHDVDKILIQDGKDMITLMTCHPYASGGKYRYLIYCERQT